MAETKVTIEPRNIYGIRALVLGNIHFAYNEDVIYPVEEVLVFHNYVTNKQRFLKLPLHTYPLMITINSNRQLLGMVESSSEDGGENIPNIVIYDVTTFKRINVFQLPPHAQRKVITRISFTCDSNALVILTDYPDEMLYIRYLDRVGTIVETRVGNSNRNGKATHISCHPQNPALVAVCGDIVMKFLVHGEKGLTLVGDVPPIFKATSATWLSPEILFLGTDKGELIFIENYVRKDVFAARTVEAIELQKDPDAQVEEIRPVITNETEDIEELISDVVCMTSFSRGLAYAIFNQVFVFERVFKTRYERKTILEIPIADYPQNLYQITNVAINPKQDTIIVTAKHSQIYVGILIVPETLKTIRLKFQTLGELIHIDQIVDISVCSWRPIVVTTSKDKTLRVWNYGTQTVELVKRFSTDITCIELYASGQYVVIGFALQAIIMKILMDDMQHMKKFSFEEVTNIRTSCFGHLLAIAHKHTITVISAFSFDILNTFEGHTGEIRGLAWNRDDKALISGGTDGALYQWSLETGNTLQKNVTKGNIYNSVVATNNRNCFFAATKSGRILHIKNSEVVQVIRPPLRSPIRDIALVNSDLVMFAATECGLIYNIQMPLDEPGGGEVTSYSFFDSPVTKMCFTINGALLITSSASGTLVIWQVKNIEGKVFPIDDDLLKSHEIQVRRKELQEKLQKIEMLEMRLKQQAAEFYNKKSQSAQNEAEQMAQIHKGYCDALNELKMKNIEIGERHVKDIIQINSQIEDIKKKHARVMEEQVVQYSERMALEYKKFSDLRETTLQTRDSYEGKLNESKRCLKDTVKALELDFNDQMEERRELIRQLIKEMEDKKLEFSQYCHKEGATNDRKLIDLQIDYEKKYKFELDSTATWREETERAERKYQQVKSECDSLINESNILREDFFKAKDTIKGLRNDIVELRLDVSKREEAINDKQRRIDEIKVKNLELEKYKHVLNHKISELKAQIEPREHTIIEKRKQIIEMEQEYNGLQKNNQQIALQLKELRDKCLSSTVELKVETTRVKSAKLCITSICSDIYQLAGVLNHPEKLKLGINRIFQKYALDNALKQFVSIETQTQAILHRQRTHMENIKFKCLSSSSKGVGIKAKIKKLTADKKSLKARRKELDTTNKRMMSEIFNMQVITKIMARHPHDPKEDMLMVSSSRIEQYFNEDIKKLQDLHRSLMAEIEELKSQKLSKQKLVYATEF